MPALRHKASQHWSSSVLCPLFEDSSGTISSPPQQAIPAIPMIKEKMNGEVFSLLRGSGDLKIVVDNAKSHSSRTKCVRSNSLSTLPLDFDSEPFQRFLEVELSTWDNYHHYFPTATKSGRHNPRGFDFSRWASSSDSDLLFISLDDMLQEESSSTVSARKNVSKPIRRNSLSNEVQGKVPHVPFA
jgi:hypothetical protein